MLVTELFSRLKATSSKKDKEAILNEYSSNQVVQEIAKFTYDKIKYVYGVRKFTAHGTKIGHATIEENWPTIKSVLKSLNNRQVTGGDAVELLESTARELKEKDREVFEAIIDRDWGCGMSTSTVNKVWKDLVSTFDVVLAKTFEGTDKQIKDLANSDYFISRKLDGCRCVAINKDDKWSFWSRQGKEFTTLNKVANQLIEAGFPEGTVLDGEICLVNENGDEDFQGVMKVIRKKGHTIDQPMYKIFDILTADEFYDKSSERIFSQRQKALDNYIVGKVGTISRVEQVPYTEEAFAGLNTNAETLGWEGLMLRKDTKYSGKRTNDLLKVKKFYDDEYVVESLELGNVSYQEKGVGMTSYDVVTAMNISHRGHRVSVGSGLSKEQRIHYFSNPTELVGKTITVQYFETTTNKNGTESLRFPTLKVIHGDERDT
jgi:DNA ligase-1